MPRALTLIPLLSVVALAGCNSYTLPSETDPASGRQVLKTVLDTWQKGGKPADAKPVVVADPDWEDGYKLTKYEIDPTDGRAGVDLLLKVKLFLKRPDGGSQDKTVNFVVGIGAESVVLRYQ